MTDKTMMQIAAMKTQTFGVEVEMYNIGRQKAAQVVSGFFGTRGTVRHEGGAYDRWTCRDQSGRVWRFDRDSSINGLGGVCELVTPILKYEDLEDLQEVIQKLRSAGARSDAGHSCGVHIHVGLQDHTAKSIRNLANLMASHEMLLIHSVRIARSRTNRWCRTVDRSFLDRLNREKPATMQALADVWYERHGAGYGRARAAHYNPAPGGPSGAWMTPGPSRWTGTTAPV